MYDRESAAWGRRRDEPEQRELVERTADALGNVVALPGTSRFGLRGSRMGRAFVSVIIPAGQTMTARDDKAATVGRSACAEARRRRAAVQSGGLAAVVR